MPDDDLTKEAKRAAAAAGLASRLSYTVDQFVTASGIGRTTVFAEIKAGRLKARKVGKRTLITAEAARVFLDSLPEREAA